MEIFSSEYLNISNEFERLGIFDSVVTKDSPFFINILRLKETTEPDFTNAYLKINRYFQDIALLLNNSSSNTERTYREAVRKFSFSEVNGINLGFSQSASGSGFGRRLSKQVISSAYEIIKKGSIQPEIFHLVGLFEDGIGPDRLSDMIATLILDEIKIYSKRLYLELGITPESRPHLDFVDGIVQNSYKTCDLLLLPIQILQELPIARSWDDIDRIISENEAIRKELNEFIGNEWRQYSSSQKKQFIKEQIFLNPERCNRVILEYQKSKIPAINLEDTPDYYSKFIFMNNKQSLFMENVNTLITPLEFTFAALNTLKAWVENNNGAKIIQDSDSRTREKTFQLLFQLVCLGNIENNQLDLSAEPNAGRGPVDFKISRGEEKVVCEIKLSSNPQYKHGYEVQIREYARAEKAQEMIYIFVDVGNSGRLETIKQIAEADTEEPKPHLFMIDAVLKESASTYAPKI